MTEFEETFPMPAPQRQRVKILFQGDGAYEVRLSRKDGRDGADTVVMGYSRVPAMVELSAGQYFARLRSLTEAAGPVLRRDLEITPQTKRLNLRDLLDFVPATSPKPRRLQPFEFSAAVRQSALRQSSDARKVPRKLRLGVSSDPVWDSKVPMVMEAWAVDDRFEIGVSSNDPRDTRGWLPATDIKIAVGDILDDGSLSIQILDDIRSRRQQRTRLTLAIAGRPAIRVPLPMFSEGCRILIFPLEVDGMLDALVRIEATDPRKQALVAALHRLDPEEAVSMLRWSTSLERAPLKTAVDVLFEKYEDAWAATVAALVLARTFQMKKVRRWAFNLERLAPHICDAGVAAAWARATDRALDSSQREDAVLEHLIRARKIGMPAFKATQGIALELLNALQGTSKNTLIRSKARYEIGIWTNRARFRLFDGPYMIWEQAGPQLQSGSLPEERYRRVAQGTVTKEGFSIKSLSAM